MVYEVISPRPHGSETFVGLHTEYPECIDPLSVQEAMLSVKKRYGKNAMLKGMNLLDGATTMERNRQIGGHKA